MRLYLLREIEGLIRDLGLNVWDLSIIVIVKRILEIAKFIVIYGK